ncbi:MAG: carboxypeptidase-like regulatory domain-containing protein [Prevotella sp.]|jgi:hypothetical protein|nr:carboxypeptidase-like regulatory domain-containing protein [Prevotella sp.]
MKGCFVLILLCITPFCIYSQTFSGRIIEKENKNPLDFVSVSLLRADSMAIDFTMTDENGIFFITNPDHKVHYLHFSCLGYTPLLIEAKNFKNGNDYCLEQSEIILKEVEVTFDRIKQSGDTLNYVVSGFRMAQDRTIKDVLKRLPGIEVEKDGRINYEGTPIEKFYVEGMNLTDGKYNLITNNLSAKVVKDIQILENHQPISTLRGIDFSDKASLNLVLEEDAKSNMLGAVDLGVGLENNKDNVLLDNRLLAMFFLPNRQNLSMYKNNNSGNDITEELLILTASTIKRMGYDADEKDIFNPISVSLGNIDKKRFLFNDTHLFTTNHLKKYNKEKSLRVQASYLYDKDKQRRESTSTYFLPETNLSINEDIHAIGKRNEIEGNIAYNQNDEKCYINNTFRIFTRFNTNNGNITGNNSIQQTTNLDRTTISNEFEFIYKTRNNSTIRLSSINTLNNLPQYIKISPGLYTELLNDTIDYDSMTQDARIRSFYSHTYTSFSHKLLGLNIAYKSGLKIKNQALRSSLVTTGAYYPALLSDSLFNHFIYTEADVYLCPSLNFQNLRFKTKIELNTSLSNIYRHDYLRDKEKNNNLKLIFNPLLTFEYNINAYYKLTTRFRYTQYYSDIYALYPSYIFTSYRYASSKNNELATRKAQNYNVGFFYKNPMKGFFYNIVGYFSIEKRNSLTKTAFNGILQQTNNIKKDVSNNNWGITSLLSKSISFWRTRFSLKYNLFNFGDTRVISDVFTKYRNESHDASFSFSTQPFRQLNMEFESKSVFARIEKTYPEKNKYPPLRNDAFKLTINYIPSKKIQIKSTNEYYYNTSIDTPFKYLSDLAVSYLIKNSEIQLLVNNIFNNNNYEFESLDALSESKDIYVLHNRQILVKYLFNF